MRFYGDNPEAKANSLDNMSNNEDDVDLSDVRKENFHFCFVFFFLLVM